MDDWHMNAPQSPSRTDLPTPPPPPGREEWRGAHRPYATPEGAAWLASAARSRRATSALWSVQPTVPGVLPCGAVFDVVNLPTVFGRRVLGQLWTAGPGCGPAAIHRGRVLLFARPGTAQRLPALLDWEEWAPAIPPLLFHGLGDAVTVPPPYGRAREGDAHWVVAPGTCDPWLPSAAILLWACVRAARRTPAAPAPALVRAPGGA